MSQKGPGRAICPALITTPQIGLVIMHMHASTVREARMMYSMRSVRVGEMNAKHEHAKHV